MRIKKEDGNCRNCSGQLDVIEADDATMTVECHECGDVYYVEPDAFGDGCMTYYVEFLIGAEAGEES